MAAAAYLERVRANGKRVLEDLHRLRSFGAAPPYVATSKGGDGVSKGVVRPALSHADIEAVFRMIDEDDSGKIDLGEWKRGASDALDPPTVGSALLSACRPFACSPNCRWIDVALRSLTLGGDFSFLAPKHAPSVVSGRASHRAGPSTASNAQALLTAWHCVHLR